MPAEQKQLQDFIEAIPEGFRGVTNPNWSGYNQGQQEEKLMFLDILAELCEMVEDKRKHNPTGGRPWLPLNEILFCMVCKVYEQLSSRRCHSDLEIARRRGYISKVPAFASIQNYFRNPELTPILTEMISVSSLPLRDFESVFAADASGLSSAFYSRWLDYRFEQRRYHDWIKINLMIGTKSQIVTAVVVSDGTSNESPKFPKLLSETAKNFDIKAVCADRGYSGRRNVQAIWDIGALPLIPFRAKMTGKPYGYKAWRKMFDFYTLYKEEFMRFYHQRSLIEACFSALKRKFRGNLMMKSEVGKVNEALAKLLAYNVCILIAEAHQNGLKIKLREADEQKPPEVSNNLPQMSNQN